MRQTVIQLLKNTTVVYVVEILSKVLTVLFLIYAARVMGVRGFGDFSYALAVLTIVSVISEYGASNLLVKMSAQENSIDRAFWTYTIFRTAATAAVIILVIAYLYVSKAGAEVLYFSALSGGGMIISCYGQNMGFAFRGQNKMHIDGIIRVSLSFFTALTGIAALKLGAGLTGVGVAYFSAYSLSTAIAFFLNKKFSLITRLPKISLSDYTSLIKLSTPLFIWMLLSIVYSRTDTILLQHIRGPEEVGLYNAASRLTEAIMIIPIGIYMGILPILSSLMTEKDNKTIEFISHLAMKYLTYLGLFIACYIALTADKVLEILYFSGEYDGAVLPMKILTWGTVASFIYIVPAAILVTSRSPHMTAWLSSISTGLNILLNVLIIPKWGFVGASAVRLITEIAGLALLNVYVHSTIVKIKYRDFLMAAFFASILTGIVISLIKSLLFLPIYFLLYAFLIYLFGGVSKEEFIRAKELIISLRNKGKTSG